MQHSRFLLAVFIIVVGCATTQPPQSPPAIPPPPLAPPPPPPPPEPRFDSFLPPDPEIRTAILAYQRTGKAPVIRRADTMLAPFLDQPFTIRCRQLLATDIELEPGERITTVLLGDTERWKAAPSMSGVDTPHVIVKTTSDVAVKTNVVMTTDRRTYRFTLLGNQGSHQTHVHFYYPRETLQRFADARAAHALAVERQQQATAQYEQDTATAHRNYHYRVQGPDVPWKPDTVFDDGTRVFLLMPPGFRTSTAPVLYVSRHGAEEQVNYTVRDSYYVIENLFERAVLLTDVGKQQQRVIIERH